MDTTRHPHSDKPQESAGRANGVESSKSGARRGSDFWANELREGERLSIPTAADVEHEKKLLRPQPKTDSGPHQQRVLAYFAAVLFIALFALPSTFSGHRFTVDVNEGNVYYVETTWWGFREHQIEIRWMQAPGYDFPGWMARDRDGEWYLFLTDDGSMDPK